MANRRVSGKASIDTAVPSKNKNGSYSTELVYVSGKVQCFAEGAFYLGWYKGTNRRWLNIGHDLEGIALPSHYPWIPAAQHLQFEGWHPRLGHHGG